MSRQLPDVFSNKDTYGINTHQERDRLPSIPQNAKVSLSGILEGGRDMPTRVCIASLMNATEADDIAKLVLGALIDSSGITPTAAKVQNTHRSDFPDRINTWSVAMIQAASAPVPDNIVEGGVAPTTTAGPQLPSDALPEWIREFGIDPQAMSFAMSLDTVETAFYAGVLAFAIGKEPTADNLEAYNSKRSHTVTSYLPDGSPKLFVENSPYLTLDILSKVHRTFNTIVMDRALVMSSIVDNDSPLVSGKARGFYVIFRLNSGVSLNPILMITKFARKYPNFYSEFPDLETEYHAAAHALNRFLDVAEGRRMYLKAIFGSSYVPVDRTDVNELLGVAVCALKQSEPSLANYSGGTLSVAHREKVLRLLGRTVTSEEEVPETQ